MLYRTAPPHTMFFVLGRGCAVSNVGDGLVFLPVLAPLRSRARRLHKLHDFLWHDGCDSKGCCARNRAEDVGETETICVCVCDRSCAVRDAVPVFWSTDPHARHISRMGPTTSMASTLTWSPTWTDGEGGSSSAEVAYFQDAPGQIGMEL